MKRALLLVIALLAGCQQAEERPYLELVPNEGREQPPPPLCEALLITWRPAAGEGPLEVDLPLPGDGPELTVRSLAIEVDHGRFEVSGEDSRVLHLTADSGAPAIRTRLQLERREPLTQEPLPPALADLPRDLPPAEWVAQAREVAPEASPRVVYGLIFQGTAATLGAWAEVELQGHWRSVQLDPAPALPADRLRLGPLQPRAVRGGAAAELAVEVQRL